MSDQKKSLTSVTAEKAKQIAAEVMKQYIIVDQEEVDQKNPKPVPKPDEKSTSAAADMQLVVNGMTAKGPGGVSLGAMLRTMTGKGKGKTKGKKKLGAYFCKTVQRWVSVSSSGSPLTAVLTLAYNNTTNVTEAAQFGQVFDECRCVAIEVHARVTGPVGSYSGTGAWALVFDPTNSGAYASVPGAIIASQKIGPIAYTETTSIGPQNFTATGYHHKVYKTIPAMPTAGASTPSENVGNGWVSTQDQSAVAGYLKIIADGISSVIIDGDVFVLYHMEYRSRT